LADLQNLLAIPQHRAAFCLVALRLAFLRILAASIKLMHLKSSHQPSKETEISQPELHFVYLGLILDIWHAWK
jgi:hypothetical protein